MRKLTFILASVVMITGCTTNSKESGYIPRSDIRIEDGVMTPETLLSFGRVSGGKLSPDSKTILYGVLDYRIVILSVLMQQKSP